MPSLVSIQPIYSKGTLLYPLYGVMPYLAIHPSPCCTQTGPKKNSYGAKLHLECGEKWLQLLVANLWKSLESRNGHMLYGWNGSDDDLNK